MSLRIVSRSDGARDFGRAFISQGHQPAEITARMLEVAPPGAAEFWIAFRRDEPVGRIGANALRVCPGTGAVGFFEAKDGEAAAALLRVAELWLRDHRMKEALGPLSLTTWFPYRFRLDDHELSFSWEPRNPREYPSYFEAAGYTPRARYLTPAAEGLAGYVDHTFGVVKALKKEGYSFRPFDGENFLEREVPRFHELTLRSYGGNYLFEPIPLEHFRSLYVPLAARLDYSYSVFALDAREREVGFFFAFADQGHVIFKTIAVDPREQGKGLSKAMSHFAAARGVEQGLTRFATGLVHAGNRSESYTRHGEPTWTHHYALYGKAL